MKCPRYLAPLLFCIGLAFVAGPVQVQGRDLSDIMELDLEDLLDIQVVSVSKRAQSAQDVAAAIYVITAEDMRRAGVTTVADALRMVPGLDVRRIDSNKWAVTSRGFNGRFSNKLLVLVDGRSVYTTLFSGVYWELQDMVLEDLDRIEVIRGPGATMWGANAVNGVINVITKHAADSQGTLVTALGGSHEQFTGAVRQGFKLGTNSYARIALKSAHRGGYEFPSGASAEDEGRLDTAGFRFDAEPSGRDALTVQGELYDGEFGQIVTAYQLAPPFTFTSSERAQVHGGSVRMEWRRTLSPTSEFSLQVYQDHLNRNELITHQIRDMTDVEMRHRFRAGGHLLSWGGGYRNNRETLESSSLLTADDPLRQDVLFNAYVQDDMALAGDRLHLTLGSKIEHNEITGAEIQPGIRLLWNVRERHRLWGSVARAVRTPSRYEHDVQVLAGVMPPYTPINPGSLPTAYLISKNSGFGSEELVASEMGYRFSSSRASLDLALFVNDYDHLRGTEAREIVAYPDHLEQAFAMVNNSSGRTYGAEIHAVWNPWHWARFDLGYAWLRYDLISGYAGENRTPEHSPEHTVTLRSAVELPLGLELDAWLRSCSDSVMLLASEATGNAHVDAYTTLDLRLGGSIAEHWRVSMVGQNLLAGDHLEYIPEAFTARTLVHNGWFVKASYGF